MLLFAAIVALASVGVRAAAIEVGDAYVREVAGGHAWTVGNASITTSIVVTKIGVLIESLARAGGRNVVVPRFSDATVTIDGATSTIGDRTWRYESASAANVDGRAVLTLRFVRRDRPVVVERRFAIAPAAPVLELWSEVTADRDLSVGDPSPFVLEFTPRDLTWQSGLETPDAAGGPFSVRTRRIDDGLALRLGSETLSSRQVMPWLTLTGDGERVVSALAWSGSWRGVVTGSAAGAEVDFSLPDTAVVVPQGQTLESPHGLIEVTADSAAEQARGMAAWVQARRGFRPYPSLVTYNSWFQFGIQIDDALIRREMDGFAGLGGELFELDAGWYPPLHAGDRFDFTAGLGSWQVDRTRFPQGLGVLADYAHARGLKFGVWVEPERVDRATVGRGLGADERFLARQQGRYQAGVDNGQATWAQICLAEDAGWTWVRDRLFGFLDEARPDYVKLDMNGWATCTREDHAHGAGGGNFGHVRGLYRLLAALRDRYPQLLIENVSGGARRLDPELLVRTDASWMDDESHPTVRVRHHHELLSTFVPPAALLSYVMADAGEPLAGTPEMRWLTRSRMLGVMGLATDLRQLPPVDADALAAEIRNYKTLRSVRNQAYAAVLSRALDVDGGGTGWDVVQHLNPATGAAVVYGFRNASGDRRLRVPLVGLQATGQYRLRSLEGAGLGTASGADLMSTGLDLDGEATPARVVIVEPQ